MRATQVPTVYFGPDGGHEGRPKVFVRLLLYSTAARGRIVEGMYARLHRGDSSQSFSVWVFGEARGELSRGAGLTVRPDGVPRDHHFLLPRDGTAYSFLPGAYKLELFALVVGKKRSIKLTSLELNVTEAQAERLRRDETAGLYFDWSPETARFHGHINNARVKEPSPLFVLATDHPLGRRAPVDSEQAPGWRNAPTQPRLVSRRAHSRGCCRLDSGADRRIKRMLRDHGGSTCGRSTIQRVSPTDHVR